MISSVVPNANVSGTHGRQTSFEVKINDKLVWSKLDQGSFPDLQKIVDQVVDTNKNSK